MQITIDGNYSRAAEVLQRGMNLIQGITLSEILDELNQEIQAEIIKHMMDKAEAIIREEEEKKEAERREQEERFNARWAPAIKPKGENHANCGNQNLG